MEKKNVFTKVLAFAGTVLVWLPILAPVIFSVIFFIRVHIFNFDFLIPAEIFPVVILGSGLLLWAAFRARSRVSLIGWSFGAAVALLVVSQALAVATGLASGRTEPAGIGWALVTAMLAAFDLAVIAVAIGGVLLLRDLYKPAAKE